MATVVAQPNKGRNCPKEWYKINSATGNKFLRAAEKLMQLSIANAKLGLLVKILSDGILLWWKIDELKMKCTEEWEENENFQ